MGHLSRSHDQTQGNAEQSRRAGDNQETHATLVEDSRKVNAASLQDVEAKHIAVLIDQHQGNRKQIAAALGISERTLYRKLKKYSLA